VFDPSPDQKKDSAKSYELLSMYFFRWGMWGARTV